MGKRTFTLVMIGVLAAAACLVTSAADPPKEAQAPPGWVLVEEDVLFVFTDEPGYHFHKARESYLRKEYHATATSLRKAAGFLRLEAARATMDGRKAIMGAVYELDTLARNVEKGTVHDVKRLDNAFARAHHSLASHHHAKAKVHQAKKEHKTAGHHVKAAVTHHESAAAWAGHKIEAGAVATCNAARTVAGKLIEGTGWTEDEVGKAVSGMGEEIEKLGKWIEPHKK